MVGKVGMIIISTWENYNFSFGHLLFELMSIKQIAFKRIAFELISNHHLFFRTYYFPIIFFRTFVSNLFARLSVWALDFTIKLFRVDWGSHDHHENVPLASTLLNIVGKFEVVKNNLNYISINCWIARDFAMTCYSLNTSIFIVLVYFYDLKKGL
jgi:hypothetical protein